MRHEQEQHAPVENQVSPTNFESHASTLRQQEDVQQEPARLPMRKAPPTYHDPVREANNPHAHKLGSNHHLGGVQVSTSVRAKDKRSTRFTRKNSNASARTIANNLE